MISSGSAAWRGSWHHGDGTISTSGETIQNLPFSYASRFEGKPGGNPEELFATAYAGCLTQALANTLDWGNWVKWATFEALSDGCRYRPQVPLAAD